MNGHSEEIDIERGLTAEQVARRKEQGLCNGPTGVVTKSVGQIIAGNVCTLFNLINGILAGLVLFTGSYKNALFMMVILCNLGVGIFQEIRAKKTIDRLSLISAPTAKLLRDGVPVTVPVSEVVQDDIAFLSVGAQIYADMLILEGSCEVNEAQITGESDPVYRQAGETLLSGGFLVSGHVKVRTVHVGGESYANRIADSAKYIKKPNSEIMRSLRLIIKVISIAIIPMGLLLFYGQVYRMNQDINEAIVQTVAALIGMIPEGLVLLTSVVLAVSVIRLSAHKTLVQELFCIETLARVDVLCLDKTGTITAGKMQMDDMILLPGSDLDEASAARALSTMVCVMEDESATFSAIAERFKEGSLPLQCGEIIPFSSDKKWSGIFTENGAYVLGAAEFVYFNHLTARSASDDVLAETIKKYADMGRRVLLLAHSEQPFRDRNLPDGLRPAAILVLSDQIRVEAHDTLRFFREQGVTLKVISGDSPETVANVAKTAGLENAEAYVDVSLLSEEELRGAAVKYTVFGRVTPQRKLLLIKALKEAGHTVAMTGDGVNDVPALKEADCSIAMASGSDAARIVSQLVLLDSNFASMPRIVAEGRRAINNIQRSASLFLVKTIFSFLLTFVFLFLKQPYPFAPIQLTLVSALCVGCPSFILALEPNRERISGKFIYKVIQKAIPGGVTVAFGVLATVLFGDLLHLTSDEVSSVALLVTAFNMFIVLLRTCLPFDKIRLALYCSMITLFGIAVFIFGSFFELAPFSVKTICLLLGIMGACIPVMLLVMQAVRRFISRREEKGQTQK